jgi:hypothetical protein
MKTLKITLSILLIASCVIGGFVLLYKLSFVLFIILLGLYLLVNVGVGLFCTRSLKEEKLEAEPIEFEFIKPVSLTGRIRVFSIWGNHLADISEDGAIIYISSKSIGQDAEIRYIQDNYETVYKSLEG